MTRLSVLPAALQKPTQPWRVFISYCQKDLPFLTALTKHLEPMKQAGWLSVWTDQCLKPGETWEPTLLKALAQAQLVLLLDSSDFAASEFIQKVELPQALALEKQGRLLVRIRVRALKRPSNDPLQAFQFLPRGDKPIEEYDDKLQNGAWAKVVTELEALILDAESKRFAPSTTPAEAEPPESPHAAPSPRSPAPSTAPAEAEPPPPLSPPGGRQSLLALLGGTVIVLLLVLLGRREGQPVPASSVVATPMASGPEPCPAGQSPVQVNALNPALALPVPPVVLVVPDPPPGLGPLRKQVADLIEKAAERGANAILLDMDFSQANGLEEQKTLKEALTKVHARKSPPVVVALHSVEPGKVPLLNACTATSTDCFDVLLHPLFLERLEGLRPPWAMVNACPDHAPGLAWTLAGLWGQLELRRAPGEALARVLEAGCTSHGFRLREFDAGRLVQRERVGSDYLKENEVQEAPIVLLARADDPADQHDILLWTPEQRALRLSGVYLQLLMAQHLHAASLAAGAPEPAWKVESRCE